MTDEILNSFCSQNYTLCLKLCEELKKKDEKALEFATISAIKLKLADKAIELATKLYESKNTTFRGLNLAKAYNIAKQYEKAKDILEELLKTKELMLDIYKELTISYLNLKNMDKLFDAYEEILKIDPYNLNIWTDYTNVVFDYNWTMAEPLFKRAIEFLTNKMKEFEKNNVLIDNPVQLAAYEKPLVERFQNIDSNKIGKYNNEISTLFNYINTKLKPKLALCLGNIYKNQESADLFGEMIPYNQKNSQFWYDYAEILNYNSMYKDAYEAYMRSNSIDNNQESLFHLAYMFFRVGNYKEGFKIYESRLAFAHNETFSKPHYEHAINAFKQNPKFLEGKNVIVFCEQGYGDTIMFATTITKLCNVANKVLFMPQSMLYELFTQSLEKMRAIDKNAYKNLEISYSVPSTEGYDYVVPLTSLPLMLDMDIKELKELPRPIFPLERKTKNKKKKIALFWNTRMAQKDIFTRNFDFDFLNEALKDSPYELISFQVDLNIELPNYVKNRGAKFNNWYDTYNAFKDIDMLITIDSAISHLALVLKIPTLVLLNPRFDWRWGPYEAPKAAFYDKNAYLLPCHDKEESIKKLQEIVTRVLNG